MAILYEISVTVLEWAGSVAFALERPILQARLSCLEKMSKFRQTCSCGSAYSFGVCALAILGLCLKLSWKINHSSVLTCSASQWARWVRLRKSWIHDESRHGWSSDCYCCLSNYGQRWANVLDFLSACGKKLHFGNHILPMHVTQLQKSSLLTF